jgi:hypothetical protein
MVIEAKNRVFQHRVMGGCFLKVDSIGFSDVKRRAAMKYFAGLDVSMEETHVCVIDQDGKVILEARTPTAPKAIAAALARGPAVERVLFETGRMAPSLYSWTDGTWLAGGLRREPTSLPGVEIAGRP